MFGFNTGLVGGISGCVSSLWDRMVSAVQTVIDTVKAKIRNLWQENPIVASVMAVVAVVTGVLVVMFFPAVAGAFRVVGSGIIRIITKVVDILMGLVDKLLGTLGRKVHG